jgi:hypothetical protein
MLNSPRVQPRQAIMELKLCGHCPKGLSDSGMSLCLGLSHDLDNRKCKSFSKETDGF